MTYGILEEKYVDLSDGRIEKMIPSKKRLHIVFEFSVPNRI